MTTKSIFYFNASDNPFLNQACTLHPSSNITPVFEYGGCYIYSFFYYYYRYIVHYALLLNHFFRFNGPNIDKEITP
jgi:hypothetical protein